LSTTAKRSLVQSIMDSYPLALLCQVLELPRSSYYYQAQEPDDSALKEVLRNIAGRWPTYGYRRLKQQLQREKDWTVNHKRVRRLMAELGITAPVPPRKVPRTTNSAHSFPRFPNRVLDLIASYPDQVWVADITYIRLQTEFVYLAVLLDVFTRGIRGWHLSRSLDQTLTVTALRQALQQHCPEIHHSDQGVQYACHAYIDLLHEHHVTISMAAVAAAWQNGYAERLMRTIKEEEVDLSDYQGYGDAYQHIRRFLEDVYMHKRIHSALGYLTPVEFETQFLLKSSDMN